MESSSALTVLDPPYVEDEGLSEPFEEYVHRPWWYRVQLPWTLWRYISLEILRVLVLSLLAVSLLYTALAAYQAVRSGIQLAFIWPFLLKTIAYPFYFSIPIAVLFGVTLGLGKLVADLETSAMRCHAASNLQLFVPVFAVGAAAVVVSHLVNGWIVPDLHYEKRNLQKYIVEQLENLGSGRNRTILLPGGGGTLMVGAHKGTRLWRVEIDLEPELQSRFVPSVEGRIADRLPERVTIMAKTGQLEIPEDRTGVIIHLRGVEVLVPERISRPRSGDDRYVHKFSITDTFSIPLSFDKRKPKVKDLRNPDLAAHIGELKASLAAAPRDRSIEAELAEASSERHRRLAFTLSSFTFPLLGAALCFLVSWGGRLLPFFLGNLVVMGIFYPLLMVGTTLGERGIFPWLSLALPNLVLLALGIAMVRKVFRQ